MKQSLQFGENVEGYSVLVLNEREVRASAGVLFFFALISFMNAWLVGNFVPTKIFVVIFLVEFTVRVLINPRYAPTLILARWIVRSQKPEYVGAPQKRWAWGFGLLLAVAMFFLIVINDIKGPLNLFICLLCLIMLFFESAFGICLGCKVYNLFAKEDARHCPGDSCGTEKHRAPIQQISSTQFTVLGVSLVLIASLITSDILGTHPKTAASLPVLGHENKQALTNHHDAQKNTAFSTDETEENPCQPPQWAIDIGHAEKWKLHHGCSE